MKKKNWLASGCCALVASLCLLLTNPQAEIGISDDWSYTFSAKRLAETGHVVYNGWATATLGAQLYLGAFFIRLFGFSFLAVRASTMVVFVLSALLLYALFMRCGIRPWSAALGVVTLLISPVYLPVAALFMSDVYGMFFVFLFFYAAIRSEQSSSTLSMALWLALAAAAGVAGGSTRQIIFLCNLVALPSLVWSLRRRHGMIAIGLSLWLASVAATLALLHWFNHQPYVVIEKLYTFPTTRDELLLRRQWVQKSLVECLLLMLPVLTPFALKFPIQQQRRRKQFMLLVGGIALAVAVQAMRTHGRIWNAFLIGDSFTDVGNGWDIFPLPGQPIAGSVQVIAAFAFLTVACTALWTMVLLLRQHKPQFSSLDRSLLYMGVPFSAGYLVLVFTRRAALDRYFLPILFLAILLALRWFEQRFETLVSPLSLIPLAALMAVAVAFTHDQFANARAQVAAVAELRASGVPRSQIDGGFSYNGWTQVETTGYMNEPRLHPSDAYRDLPIPAELLAVHPMGKPEVNCYPPWYPYTPSVHAHFMLQTAPDFCFPNAAVPPVQYRAWLPPRQRTLYIGKIDRSY